MNGRSMIHGRRRHALLLCFAIAALAAVPTPAAAAPCGDAVIADWSDGSIDRLYPVACYRQALERLPEDLRAYSSAPDDIERALLERVRDTAGAPPQDDERAPEQTDEETPRALAGARPPAAAETAEGDAAEREATRSDPPPTTARAPDAADAGAEAAADTATDESNVPAAAVAAVVGLLAAAAAIPLVRAGRRRARR